MGLYIALQFDLQAVPGPMWGLLVLWARPTWVWTVWLPMTGLIRVPAAQDGVFTVMLPVSAAAVGVLVWGEPLDWLQVLALGIAVAGVLLATVPSHIRT